MTTKPQSTAHTGTSVRVSVDTWKINIKVSYDVENSTAYDDTLQARNSPGLVSMPRLKSKWQLSGRRIKLPALSLLDEGHRYRIDLPLQAAFK